MSQPDLILITGVNGYIGARTVEAFLKAGHSVRGTVRSKKSADELVAALSEYSSRLEIVEVPEITAPGAFDEAVKGVTGIAHLASPVGFQFTEVAPILKAAVDGTLSILQSALKEPSVKSFVIMSSIAAIRDFQREEPHVFTEADWNEGVLKLVEKLGDNTPGRAIYAASKVASERRFWQFRDENKPHFAMAAINPVFVFGPPLAPPESPEKISNTTRHIWTVLSGQPLPPSLGADWYVDVRDVSRLVVWAVDHPEVTNGERYLASGAYAPVQAVADVLRNHYPNRPIQAGSPGQGYLPGYKAPGVQDIDASKAVKVSGQDYIPFEQTVLDAAKQFEHLLPQHGLE